MKRKYLEKVVVDREKIKIIDVTETRGVKGANERVDMIENIEKEMIENIEKENTKVIEIEEIEREVEVEKEKKIEGEVEVEVEKEQVKENIENMNILEKVVKGRNLEEKEVI